MNIKVKVNASSDIEEIRKIGDDEYVVSVKEPAENNKANIRLINLLSKEFGVDFRKIKIKNPTSRRKFVEIK